MINILSLGAGVQSTTLLLMSIKGLLPKLDCAIFADIGWEPTEVYLHLERLMKLSVPIHIVRAGDLRFQAMGAQIRGRKINGVRWTSMPLYVSGNSDGGGQIKRQCTAEYKIKSMERFIIREILGIKPHGRRPKEPVIELWMGISIDEVQRMKDSREPWKVHQYPLCGYPKEYFPKVYSRDDCLEWLGKNWDYPVPRSACLGCPYHSNSEWRLIKSNPAYWRDVTEFDRAIRRSGGMRAEVFLHRSLKPLEDVDLRTSEDRGQINLFGNECEGMCGV